MMGESEVVIEFWLFHQNCYRIAQGEACSRTCKKQRKRSEMDGLGASSCRRKYKA